MSDFDAIVVGAGPNGLTAANTLARHGLRVLVYEAAEGIGGGARTEELTLPGHQHDPCSAVHPLGAGSPAFARFPLERFGLEWVEPELALAHPLTDRRAGVLARSVEDTAVSLEEDQHRYRGLVGPFADRWPDLAANVLGAPLAALPRDPVLLGRFALRAGLPAAVLTRIFHGDGARALLAGLAAHVMAPLHSVGTGGVAVLFALAAHAVGWPFPRGGSQRLSDALAGYFRELNGELVTNTLITSWRELPSARAYLFDVAPTALASIVGDGFPDGYTRQLRLYRYGPGVFKVDYALDGPVPWTHPECQRSGTVHLGDGIAEIGAALRAAHQGSVPDPPFIITAQPSVFDSSRAPAGRHVFWAYAHVPNGWRGDLTEAIEKRIERFAPGFRDRVLARAVHPPAAIEARDPNYVGGDIGCGSFTGTQTVFRPSFRAVPYATPNPRVYVCSAATPPGPGVHGMCGYHAANTALRRRFGMREGDL